MSTIPKIVVLTPVKNEAWILDRFLAVTSLFADLIIISDQNSIDGSRDIYKKYPKVHLIENTDTFYNEASRQNILIETARKLVPGPRILLALDSDEILAANAIETSDWQNMLKAESGTIIYFEKPDLYKSPMQVLRFKNRWPLGYVDDGCQHHPTIIHSTRIPQPDYAKHLYLKDVIILHYALTRSLAQNSKMRYYSVIENLNNTSKFYTRRKGYAYKKDYTKNGWLEKSDLNWFNKWQELGIDMLTIPTQQYYWQDFEILRLFKKHGYRRFWLDDIWYFNWEEFRKYAIENNYKEISEIRIKNPPMLLVGLLKICDKLQKSYNTFKTTINNIKLSMQVEN
jgi:hypothetical protein